MFITDYIRIIEIMTEFNLTTRGFKNLLNSLNLMRPSTISTTTISTEKTGIQILDEDSTSCNCQSSTTANLQKFIRQVCSSRRKLMDSAN